MNADRILGPLEALIRRFTAHIDYYARYPAKVIQQQSDGTLDVVPEDTRVPPMQNVPIRYGLPGVKAEVVGGGRVLVGFEGGNPQRPMVELWDFSAIVEIIIDGGTKAVARVDDTVEVTLTAADVVELALASSSGAVTAPTPTNQVTLSGKITFGNPKVKA